MSSDNSDLKPAIEDGLADDQENYSSLQQIRKLEHELRNCQCVISSGAYVLQLGRPDAAKTTDILEQILANNKNAGNILSEIIKIITVELETRDAKLSHDPPH